MPPEEQNLYSHIPSNSKKESDTPAWFLLFSTFIVLFGAIFFIFHKKNLAIENQSNPNISVENKEKNKTTTIPSAFENINITAKSAFVWDVKMHTILYAKNAEAQLPLASLTKLMTAVTAKETIPEYTVITIDKNALTESGDSGLKADEQFTLKDILNFTLVVSSNDGARAIASAVGAVKNGSASSSIDDSRLHEKTFIADMNEKAKAIGMVQSYFINETGLDSNDHQSGGYGSAKDTTLLFEYILKNHPDLLLATTQKTFSVQSLENKKHVAKNTDTIVETIPSLLGSKTGYTDLAGGNLVIGFDASFGEPIIITVLGSTEKDRFEDMKKLVNASISELGKNITKIEATDVFTKE